MMWWRKFAVVMVEVNLWVVTVVAVTVPPARRVELWIVCRASEAPPWKLSSTLIPMQYSIIASVHKFCCRIVSSFLFQSQQESNKNPVLASSLHPSYVISLYQPTLARLMTCAVLSNYLTTSHTIYVLIQLHTIVAHRFNRNTAPTGKWSEG